ncbi:hypothetical protein CRG98_012894 [Punica granatum]|uniref:Uncharacterized protein n=1 Tax=Punica granatum TaxID=22663 RepID=A0A2I0KDW4_PUNGR|nr:hypothetical protein CRG98_012894 [Punica granatum]
MYERRLNLPLPMDLHSPGDNLTNILEPYQLQMLKSAAISGRMSGQTLHGILRGNSRNLDQLQSGLLTPQKSFNQVQLRQHFMLQAGQTTPATNIGGTTRINDGNSKTTPAKGLFHFVAEAFKDLTIRSVNQTSQFVSYSRSTLRLGDNANSTQPCRARAELFFQAS